MIYRPQYAYPSAPPGYRDEEFCYAFDGSNVTRLSGTIQPGQTIPEIQLQLEADAPFLWRGYKIDSQEANTSLEFVFREPNGYTLAPSGCYLPVLLSGLGAGDITPVGRTEVNLEPEIPCAAGATVGLFLFNPTGAPITYSFPVQLFGVKRRREECC